jgi:Flp pilus assembly protein TadG
MVESALTLLTFLLLLLGAVDFGQVMYFQQSLMERARQAARYGAGTVDVSTGLMPTTDNIKNMAVYNSSTTTGSPSAVLPGLTTAMVSVTDTDANTANARVVVTISGYPINFLSPYITGSFNNLVVTAAMTSETQVP